MFPHENSQLLFCRTLMSAPRILRGSYRFGDLKATLAEKKAVEQTVGAWAQLIFSKCEWKWTVEKVSNVMIAKYRINSYYKAKIVGVLETYKTAYSRRLSTCEVLQDKGEE